MLFVNQRGLSYQESSRRDFVGIYSSFFRSNDFCHLSRKVSRDCEVAFTAGLLNKDSLEKENLKFLSSKCILKQH